MRTAAVFKIKIIIAIPEVGFRTRGETLGTSPPNGPRTRGMAKLRCIHVRPYTRQWAAHVATWAAH